MYHGSGMFSPNNWCAEPTTSRGISRYPVNVNTDWYPTANTSFNFITDTPPSNSREMRNRAEKKRRDKMNFHISELATLVPMVYGSPKRMDKTSILRLTATHLRIYHTLLNGTKTKNEFSMVDQIALEQLMYEQMEGFLLIVTRSGKIIFVSHTVEQILGHLQTDLMGQSIYTFTSPEDHDVLKLHLDSDVMETDSKRYFRINLAKAGPRTESPTYETVIMGVLRPFNGSRKKSMEATHSTNKNNSEVLVFFVRLFRLTLLSEKLIEASKDEYVTRHLVDGRIINCDHRISFVAGYMIEEVSGLSAFKFMHKEDVRWSMIALRQMYDKGESKGWSCYRLLSRSGQFIYLKSTGYLEMDNNGVVESFFCVNTLLNDEIGHKLITEMKKRYSVMINANPIQLDTELSVPGVEDPDQLDACIRHLITNIPASSKHGTTSPKPATPQESQDCYVTEIPAIEVKTNSKRSSDDEATPRKRQKKRNNSTSSTTSSMMSDAYSPDGNITLTNGTNHYQSNFNEMMRKENFYQSSNLLSHNVGL